MAIVNISGTINSSFSTSGVLVNAAQAAGDAVFTIDLRPTNPIIIVQDNLNYPVLLWNINDAVAVITLVGPQGEIYKNENYLTPDIVPATSRYLNKTITLPLDPLANYTNILKGNYTLKISWYNSVLDEYYTFLDVYQYNMDPPTIANTTTSGPYTGILTSTDTTAYGGGVHQIIRQHRIEYPDELAVPPPDVVSSNAVVQVTPIYTNEWTITINSFVEYRFADLLRVLWEGDGTFTHCVYGGCIGAMYDAIETMLTTYREAMACNLNDQEAYQKRLVIVNTAWHLLNEAYWSGDAVEADEQAYIIQEQVEYTGGGICGGATSELVVPCPPWTGGGTGGTYTFSNGLTEAAGNVVWGGTLTQPTTINMAGNEVLFSGSNLGNTVSQSISASGGILQKSSDGTTEGRVYVTQDLVTLERADLGTPTNTRGYELTATGIVEKGDYKAGYVDRQLVAKDYVDTLFAGAATYTFENALTDTAGVVRVGGAMTQNTVITAGAYTWEHTAAGPSTSQELYMDSRRIRWSTFAVPDWEFDGHWGEIQAQSTLTGYSDVSMAVGDPDWIVLLSLNTNLGMYIFDDMFNRGLVYFDDYSLAGIAYGDRWIPDYGAVKAYADSVAGVTAFTGLSDTPASYTGFGSYFLRVNAGATAVEFVTGTWVPVAGGTFTGQVTIATSTDRPLILQQIGAGSTPGTPEAGINYLSFQDNDGDEQGYIGIDASGNVILSSSIIGGGILANDSLSVQGDINLTGSFYTDFIYEKTANHGVIVDGVTLKDGIVIAPGLGTGAIGAIDAYIGDAFSTPTYGLMQVGNSVFGRSSINVASLDLDGSVLVWNQGLPATSNIEFAFANSANDIRFALAVPGAGNATYSPRSMLIVGPAPANDAMVTVGYWSSIFDATKIPCDTSTTGADLGVQNNVQIGGTLWVDTIGESTTAAGVTVSHPLALTGIVNASNTYVLHYNSGTGAVTYALPSTQYIPYGTKQSSVDAGTVGEMSVDDDYLYICVTTGGVGLATWKRTAILQSP